MPVKIVYLGWGSLLWNYKDLKIDAWKQTDLVFPLEFSRMSQDGRVTLVIDEKYGGLNKIWSTQANYKNIDMAINALKKREKTLKTAISYVNLPKKSYRIRNTSPKLTQEIVMWSLKEKIDVIIWTDLASNWQQVRGKEYSVNDALEYFKSAPIITQMNIFDYIFGATQVGKIKTPFSTTFLKFMIDYLKNISN